MSTFDRLKQRIAEAAKALIAAVIAAATPIVTDLVADLGAEVREIVIAAIAGALVAGGATYRTPNRPKPKRDGA